MQWLQALQRYNFVIGYHPGKENSVADALSRRQDLSIKDKDPKPTTLFAPGKFIELNHIAADSEITVFLDAITMDQEILEQITRKLEINGEENLPHKEGRILVPEDDNIRKALLALYHDSPMAGHPGITRTYDLLGRMYTWKNMRTYVEDYVHGCTTCAKAKKKNTKAHGKLQPLPNPMRPWHWTESDLIGPLPRSKGKDAIYVVVDRFTKYAYFVPCNTTETA